MIRLDRHTGRTWQFVEKEGGGYAWQTVFWENADTAKSDSGKAGYQIFASGILAKQTVLINTDTGVSWYIAEDPESGLFWTLLE